MDRTRFKQRAAPDEFNVTQRKLAETLDKAAERDADLQREFKRWARSNVHTFRTGRFDNVSDSARIPDRHKAKLEPITARQIRADAGTQNAIERWATPIVPTHTTPKKRPAQTSAKVYRAR